MVSRLSPTLSSFWSKDLIVLRRINARQSSSNTFGLSFSAAISVGLSRFHRGVRMLALTRSKGFTVSKAISKTNKASRYRAISTSAKHSFPINRPDRLRSSYHKYIASIKLLPSLYLAQSSVKLSVSSRVLLSMAKSGYTCKAYVNGSATAAQFSILNFLT